MRGSRRHLCLFPLGSLRKTASLAVLLIFALSAIALPFSLPSSTVDSSPRPIAQAGPSSGLYFDHVVVIVMENEGLQDTCSGAPPPCVGSNGDPYLAALANQYGIASHYDAIMGFSQPNYVDLLGGNATQINCASPGPCSQGTVQNLVDSFTTSGLSWRGYMESQPTDGCYSNSVQPYDPIHNPFIWFTDINGTSRCNNIVSSTSVSCGAGLDSCLIHDLNSGSAPNFMWLTPNNCDNIHGASVCQNGCPAVLAPGCLTAGDTYLSNLVPTILSSNTFKTQRSALFITFDEGQGFCPTNGSSEQCVYAVWAGPTVKDNFVTSRQYNHYSFVKTIETNWSLANFTYNSLETNASSMSEFFRNPSTPASWNQYATCPPTTINSIDYLTGNKTGLASFSASPFTPGINSSYGPSETKSWLTNSSLRPLPEPGWKSPGPSCQFFVQIDGVLRSGLSIASPTLGLNSSSTFKPINGAGTYPSGTQSDDNFTIFDPNFGPPNTGWSICQNTNTTCRAHTILAVIDKDWKGASYCGQYTTCDDTSAIDSLVSQSSAFKTLIDVQGFVFWNPSAQSWELHPLTAWRPSNSSPDLNITATSIAPVLPGKFAVSNVALHGFNLFSGIVSLSAKVTGSSSASGTPPTPQMNPYAVYLPPDGTTSVKLNVTTSSNTSGTYVITVTASNGTLTRTTIVSFTMVGFIVSASPPTIFVASGQSANSTVSLTSQGSYNGTVTLSATSSCQPCANPQLSQSSVKLKAAGTNTTILEVLTSGSSNATITFTATSTSPQFTTSLNITVRVYDFSIGPSQPPLTTNAGQSKSVTVFVTSLNGFGGTVTLGASSIPTGPTVALNATTVTLTSNKVIPLSLTFNTTKAGTYTLTITGTSSPLVHQLTITVNVVDFNFTSSPATLQANVGLSRSATLTVSALSSFSGMVSLTDVVPSGLTCGAIGPNIITGSGTATVSCSSIAVGNYTLTVTGTSTTLTHTLQIRFNIVDFSISAGPVLPASINVGSFGNSTITLTGQNGFAETVGLSVFAPSGLTCSLSSTSLALSSSPGVSVLSCKSSTAVDYTTVTVNGINGTLSRTTKSIAFHFVDFTLKPSSSSVSLVAGSATGLDSVLLTSLNGFNSTVNVSVSVLPSGPSAQLQYAIVRLTPQGNSTALTISPGPFAGTFNLNVTGTNGSRVRSTLITLIVAPASPTVTTSIKDSSGATVTSVTAGTQVHDSATINGGSQPAGSVAYVFFSNGACTAPGTAAGTVIVTNGVVPDSQVVSPLTPGSYSFVANYTGDANNNKAVSSCEPLNVTSKLTPTISTTLKINSGATVTTATVGTAIHDTATLSGGSPVLAGTVTYFFFTNNQCLGTPTTQFPPFPQTVPVGSSNSVPSSASLTTSAGLYSFNATYSGDATDNPATSPCEPLTISKQTPNITTTISPSSTIIVGASVTDDATLAGGYPLAGVTGSVTYAFFNSVLCVGTPAATSIVTVGAGNSLPASNSVIPPSAGSFAFNATYSGDANNTRVSSTCEPLTVQKATPTISTTISPSSTITVGASVTDQATLTSGFPSTGMTGSVTYAFFGNSVCSGAPSSVSTFAVGAGNSVPASSSVTPSAASSFAFNATYNGDTNNNRVSSSCEPLTVNKTTPSITTTITPSLIITVGASASDQATLTSGFPLAGVTGTVTYSFFSGAACTGAPATSSSVSVGAANSVPASASVTPASAGSFAFNATYNGDANNNRVSSSCEPLTVNKQTPSITTAVSPSSTIIVGASFSDQATLTGGFPSTGMTGSVTYAFFNNNVCSGAATSTTVSVGAADAVPSSGPVTPSSAGSFAFNATYGGDANNNRVSSSCEPLTVNRATPSITTIISPSSTITVGASVTDQAFLTSGFPSTGVTGIVVYAFFSNGACTGLPASTSTVTVGAGDIVPTSGPITPTSAGSFAFNATYTGDVNNNRVSSVCEPLTVQKATPGIATSIKNSSGTTVTSMTVGGSVTDQAVLSGGFPSIGITGGVTYAFFNNGACTGTPASVSTVAIGSANAVPPSASVTPPSVGSFAFNATYTGDGNNNRISSACEPLTVIKQTPSITTTISPSSTITVGSSVTDQAILTSTFPTSGATGSVVYSFFGNGACTGIPTSTSTVTVGGGNSVPISGSVTPTSAGSFAFNATYTGDTSNNRVSSPCEPLTVTKQTPVLNTSITPSSTVVVGTAISDQVTLTGGFPSSGITGTVSYYFFTSGSCTGTAVPEGSVNIGLGNSVPASSAVTPSPAGVYSFNATYGGDNNNNRVSSTCEPLTVTKQNPTITTTILPSSAVVVATSVTDQATITGGFPSTGLGGSMVYHFFGPSNGVCSGVPTSSQTVSIGSSNSVAASGPQTPSVVGQYSFNATYSGDANNNPSTSSCELLTVNSVSTTTGIVCSSSVTVGIATSCTVTISDMAPGTLPPTGTVNLSTNSSGTFNPGSTCTISGTGSSASCIVSYTPSILGAHNITAIYVGDSTHKGSAGSIVLTPGKHPTVAIISCNGPVLDNEASTCTVTVTDTSTTSATTPTGSVAFTQSGPSGNFNATSCSLIGSSSTASCGVTFTPSAIGVASVVSTYTGDATHAGSGNSASITVNPALIVNTPLSTPSTIDTGQSAILSTTFSGGTAPFNCQWRQEPPGTNTFSNLGTSSSCTSPASVPIGTLTTVGTWSFELQITDSSNNPVTTISSPTTVTVNGPLVPPTISTTPTALDLGQSSTLATTISFAGGSPTFTCQWAEKAPGSASYSNLGTSFSCVAGSKPGVSTGPLSSAGLWSFELKVIDSGSPAETATSNAASLTVNPTPTPPSILAAPTTINSGQSATLSTASSFSGGTSPYSCIWLEKAPGATGYSNLGASFSCTVIDKPTIPTGALIASGTWTFELQVTDTGSPPIVSTSSTASVSVNTGLTAGAITPGAPTIDSGQSLILFTNPSGGTTPYSYQWYSDGACTTAISGQTSSTFSSSPTGNTTYSYKVTDSASSSVCSPGNLVTVNLALLAGAVTPSTPKIDNGQSVTLSANPSDGTSPYTYHWFSGTSSSCSSDNTPLGTSVTQTVSPTISTFYCYKLTDSSQGAPTASATSATNLVTVNPPLVAGAITPSGPIIDKGQVIVLTAQASGGTPSLSYQWYSATSCTGAISGATTATYVASPASSTTYSYSVTDSSYQAATLCSPSDTVTVNQALVAGPITPSAPTIDAGQSITLIANPSGGTSPYAYQWYSGTNPICSSDATTLGTASTQLVSPTASTFYCYTVTDPSVGIPAASATSPTDLITVSSVFSISAPSAGPSTIDTGQFSTLSTTFSGGTSPYACQWLEKAPGSISYTKLGSSSSCTSPASISTGTLPTVGIWSFELQVNDTGSPSVSITSSPASISVNGALVAGAVTPNSPTIDAGQSVSLTANPAGGTTPYSYQWYSAASCVSGSLISGATSSTYVPSPTSTTSYSYKVSDGSQGTPAATQCSPGDAVAVNSALLAGPITPSNPIIDSGQSTTLTSHASSGTAPLSYQWYSDGTCASIISGATSLTYSPSPASTATYSYKVTDSSYAPTSQCSAGVTATVNPGLVAGPITPTSPTINNGQSVTLTANPSGGTLAYSYQWYADGVCTTSIPTATLSTYSASPTSKTIYSYRVTDASQGSPAVSTCSPGDTVTVNSPLSAGPISPSSPTIDNGQSIVLTSAPSGGTTPYLYQWFAGGSCTSAVTGATSATYTASPTAATAYSYRVTDSALFPSSVCSPSDIVTVNLALTAGTIAPSNPTIDIGQSILLTAGPSGGTTPYSYQWYAGTSATCSSDTTFPGASSSQNVAPTTTTYYCYTVTDSAFTHASQSSLTSQVKVNAVLTASAITPSNPTIDNGQSVVLTANPLGGAGPYSYQWYSGSSSTCSSDTAPLGISSTQIVSSTLTAYYCYRASDSSSGSPSATAISSTDQVIVNTALTVPSLVATSPIDSGQSTSVTISWSGGTAPYTATLYTSTSASACTGLVQATQSTGLTGSSTTFTESPIITTNYCATVADGATSPALTQTSSSHIVVVNLALAVNSPSSTASTLDSGQSSTLSATFTGGTSPYICQWLEEAPGATSYVNLGGSSSCTSPPTTSTAALSTPGTWSFELQVTDGSSIAATATSTAVTVTVNPALVAPEISTTPTTIGAGQKSTLFTTTSFSGGTPTYSCLWLKKGPLDPSYNNLGISFSCNTGDKPTASTGLLSTSGFWSFKLQVTDNGSPAQVVASVAVTVTVNGALSAGAIAPSAPAIDVGQSITLTSNAFGGVAPYSYQWYSDGACTTPIASATLSALVASPTASVTYSYNVTDSGSVSQCSPGDIVTVNPALTAGSITPSSPNIDSGRSVLLTATPSGGSSPYSYQWYSGANCATAGSISGATASTYVASPASTATYSYKVTDVSTGTPGASHCSPGDLVTVNSALAAGAITPLNPTLDAGQSITLTSHGSGGTTPLSYQWYSDGTCSNQIPNATSGTYSTSPTTTTIYSYKVSDSAISPESLCSAGDTVSVNSGLIAGAITPAIPSIDTGQTITLTANPSGGTTPYAYQWYSGTSSTCASDTNRLGTAQTQAVFPTTNTYYCYAVSDSGSSTSQSSLTDLVSVNPALSAGTITPPSSGIDMGQTIPLMANPSGGTTPYHYLWYSGSSTTCPTGTTPLATSVSLSVSPASSASYCYTVTDSSTGSPSVSATSASSLITVNPSLSAGAITPSSPMIDNGQSISLSSNPSGGTGPYKYQWYSGSNPTCSSDNTLLGTTASQTVSPTTLTYYCYSLSDSSAGMPTATLSSVTTLVQVNLPLAAGNITPLSPMLDNGQSIALTANPSGGTPSNSFQWYADGTCTALIPFATSQTFTVSPPSTTVYSYKVTDSAYSPSAVCSPSDTVTANQPLIAGAITPSSPTIDRGQSLTLTANPSGGTSAYSYQWFSGTSSTCSSDTTILGSGASVTVSPASSTNYCYRVTDSAYSPSSQSSATVLVTVNPVLVGAAIAPSSPTIDRGQAIQLTSHASGGTAPLSYQWFSDPTCTIAISGATSSSYFASPASTTTYSYRVTDSAYSQVSQCSPYNTLSVNTALSVGIITPSAPTIDTGQSITLTANPSGGTTPYLYQWYSGTSPSCVSDVTPLGTGFTLVTSPTSTTFYCYTVADSSAGIPTASATSSSTSITVNPNLAISTLAASSPIDSGQSTSIILSWTGGTSPYTVTLYTSTSSTTCIGLVQVSQSSGVAGTTVTFNDFPTSATSYCAWVTDSAYSQITSKTTSPHSVTVYPALSAGPITPNGSTIDSGQVIILTSHSSGGASPLSYQWYSDGACTTIIPASTGMTFTASPTTTTIYSYKVTDASQGTPAGSRCSPGDTVTVSPSLVAGAITPSGPTIDAGQSFLLTATVSGGTTPYTYQWYSGSSSICSSDTSVLGQASIQTVTPVISTYYCYTVIDSSTGSPSASATSAANLVTINSALAVSGPASAQSSLDSGQATSLSAAFTGGTPSYSCQWLQQLPSSNSFSALGTSSSCGTPTFISTGTLSTVGTWAFRLRVTDGSGSAVNSSSIQVVVNPDLGQPTIAVSQATASPGQSSTLSTISLFTGGTPSYTCQWLERSPLSSSYNTLGNQFSCNGISKPSASTGTLTTAGFWYFSLQVTDSGSPQQMVTSQSVTLVVQKATPSIQLSLSNTNLKVGGTSTGSATITDGFQVTGNVTFHVFIGSACVGSSLSVGSPVLVSNVGTFTSSVKVFNSAGLFAWNVMYSGDLNNNAITSLCQTLTVVPTISTPATLSVSAGSTVSFSVNATDPDTTQTITITPSNLPAGATFSSAQSFSDGTVTSIFRWTPDSTGNYTVTFTASANGVSSASQVTIHVGPVQKSASLPIVTYSIFGVVGFIIVITAAILLRRFQNPRRSPKF